MRPMRMARACSRSPTPSICSTISFSAARSRRRPSTRTDWPGAATYALVAGRKSDTATTSIGPPRRPRQAGSRGRERGRSGQVVEKLLLDHLSLLDRVEPGFIHLHALPLHGAVLGGDVNLEVDDEPVPVRE